jgi:antitoxin (DNA-binding transcriptional repressor) of toxin-antitoxin stability system
VDRVNARSLRSSLAAHLRRAEQGERIVVTVGGRAVAQLGPLEADPGSLTLDDLVARGLLLPAHRLDRPDPSEVMPLWAGARIDRLLREVRGR